MVDIFFIGVNKKNQFPEKKKMGVPIDSRLDSEWNEYIDQVSIQTKNRYHIETLKKGHDLQDRIQRYDNWHDVKKSSHNILSKIPIIDVFYLLGAQRKLAEKDKIMNWR